MIQELFGCAAAGFNLGGAGGVERKISISSSSATSLSPSPSLSPSSSTTTSTNTTTAAAAAGANNNSENLRCPRCDSANTKFCYYNNYNLTQPRHFCKTCRRYWTKGGALRNVPIGGGCRKNKSAGGAMSSTSITKSTAVATGGKLKTLASEIMARSSGSGGFGLGFDQLEMQASPILWGSPQNSHILALLRSTSTSPNPNPNPNVQLCMKEESTVPQAGMGMGMNMIGSHMMMGSESSGAARSLGLDPSTFWRSNQNVQPPPHHHHQLQNGNNFILGGGHEVAAVQSNQGIQELFLRLRSSASSSAASYYSPDQNNNGASSSTSSILESAGPAELGYNNWNPAFTWSTTDQLPTANGAYP